MAEIDTTQAAAPAEATEASVVLGGMMGGLDAANTDTVPADHNMLGPAPAKEAPAVEATPAPVAAPATTAPATTVAPAPAPAQDGPTAAEALAGKLTHTDVKDSPAFKGMLAEAQKERKARKAAELELAALKGEGAEQDAEDDDLNAFFAEDDPTPEPTDDDFDNRVDAAVEKRLAPLMKERADAADATKMGDFDASIQGLVKAQTEGRIPEGLDVEATVVTAVTWLDENRPEMMKSIRGESKDPAAEAYQMGAALCPAVRDSIKEAAAKAPKKAPVEPDVEVGSVAAFTDIMASNAG